MWLALGILGAFVGSYLNVLAFRFSPEEGFSASRRGRSYCPHCRKALAWYELIPVLSFLFQGGRCRKCRKRISFQYPAVELLSAAVFIFIPWQMGWSLFTALWILVFLVLLLVALIDLRLGIIPDKLNLLLAGLGLLIAGFTYVKGAGFSFLGSYALLFQLGEGNFWLHRIAGIFFGLAFFGSIYLFSKGKGMGLGDVKLAGTLGLLLGWPDAIFALLFSFLAGSFIAVPLIAVKRKAMKDPLPFAPFIVVGVTLVFFFGYHILNGYFEAFNFY